MSSEVGYQICPGCHEEYTLSVTRCVECDVALVAPDEITHERDAQEVPFPPASELTCIRVAPLAWIRALSDTLEQSAMGHRVEPANPKDAPEDQNPEGFGDVDLFGLYVEAGDVAAAREIDGAIAAQVIPEDAPLLAEGEVDACPACGDELPADTLECPGCGLVFG